MPAVSLTLNRLLNRMPESTRSALGRRGRIVEVQLSEVLSEPGELWEMFFPLDCVVSVVQQLSDGTEVEVAMVGPEAFAGTNVFLGVPHNPRTLTAQSRGTLLRIDGAAAREIIFSDGDAQQILMRSVHFFAAQVSQLAVCNRIHKTDERLAHWLLLLRDRVGSNELAVTHEFLAHMLATRRPGITVAMQTLSELGAIEQFRNRVRIVDDAALEAASCECYAAIVEEYDLTFGQSQVAKGRATPQM